MLPGQPAFKNGYVPFNKAWPHGICVYMNIAVSRFQLLFTQLTIYRITGLNTKTAELAIG